MSIFKDTFHPDITAQIDVRQSAINNRTPKNLQYYNSRASWIRLSSSVNTYNGVGDIKDGKSYNNNLAKKYILQGGTLNENGSLRSGLGDFSKAYSNISSDNTTAYRLGIRPMPGITNVEIRSKGAYGSLREATVNFQCWDIHQLEDLELLYMRPGYTVLLEWGWSLHLKNDGKLNNIIEYTDIINQNYTKEELFKKQYTKSTVDTHGNCDSMFGFVKNYSWKARMDGGYDCTTTIISLGEVIESLKVNYLPLENLNELSYKGKLSYDLGLTYSGSFKELKTSYSTNVLAGLFEELYEIGESQIEKPGFLDIIKQAVSGKTSPEDDGYHFTIKEYDFFYKKIDIKKADGSDNSSGPIGKSDEQVYITLETLTAILNNYVLLRDKQANAPFTKLSVFEQGKDRSTSDLNTGDGCLLALAHPLELSVDPSVCLIKNNLWINGIKFVPVDTNTSTASSNVKYGTAIIDEEFWRNLAKEIEKANGFGSNASLKALVKNTVGEGYAAVDNLKEIQRQFINIIPNSDYNVKVVGDKKISDYKHFYDLLNESLFPGEIKEAIGVDATKDEQIAVAELIQRASKENPEIIDKAEQAVKEKAAKNQETKLNEALGNLKFLDNLQYPYFTNNNYKNELGIIGNIYVNLGMLYSIAIDSSLASQDRKEKNDISLYDFIKTVLVRISSATGEVNNFDLFVDPVDNTARIIDINYVDRKQPKTAYDDAYTIQVQNLNSIVRSYSLESKIFPEQSTIVAIGAQIEGGALGIDTSTLVDFNKKILDRIIPIKDAPSKENDKLSSQPEDKLSIIMSSVSVLTEFFSKLEYGFVSNADFDVNQVGKYQNALKDLINYYKAITNTKIKNKAIIPTKLSLEMDGIGGIIIGNLFKIPEDNLPKGYKGGENGYGSKLGYIVTGIGHSLQSNDWVTKIDAQTVVLDEPQGIDPQYQSIRIEQTTDGKAALPIDITNTQQVTPAPIVDGGKGNKDAMKLAGDTVFNKNGEVIKYCARYTYAIARNYIAATKGKTPDGKLGLNGNSNIGVRHAGDLIYRKNLTSLGYNVNYLGVISKKRLIQIINDVKDIGTIINYRSTKDVGGSDNYWKYGHTQIYTGGVLDTSRGSVWASSKGNNYNKGMVYENTVPSDSWECYIFTLN